MAKANAVSVGTTVPEVRQQAVLTVARENLADAESLRLDSASTEELTYHFCVLKRSLREVLTVVAP
ncbi:hypothetical protein SUDANB171_02125 [Streptomyces sp. enrichment culture]|uniref:hypothetical protein n=1 Tax=Streptomyces xiamenensis TaxID=408015 RepID=UPI0037CF26B0